MPLRGTVTAVYLVLVSLAAPVSFAQRITAPENYMIIREPGMPPAMRPIPPEAFSYWPGRPGDSVAVRPNEERVHHVVQGWMRESAPDERITVLVVLNEDRPYPFLPQLRRDLDRDGAENQQIVARRHEILARFAGDRARDHRKKVTRLGEAKFHLRESFAAANVMAVETTVGAIADLLADSDVRHVEPAFGNDPPPQATTPTVKTGRTWMGSDFWAYYAFNLSGNRNAPWQRIALLDTGVRSTHTLLAGRINYARDCVRGTANFCQTGTSLNPGDALNHGTSSAAIMSGTANLGDDYKGVSFYKINSYKVYSDTSGGLDPEATLRAFLAAQAAGDEVIVAEMQADANTSGAITNAAEVSVTQYGIAVVAAVGNGSVVPFTDTAVRAPANGRNVLAVGGYQASNGSTILNYSRGPTPDGRIKPEILTPVAVATASNVTDTSIRTGSDAFSGTSCATAFAGGLASVMYNQNFDSPPPDPGILLDMPGWIYTQALMDGERGYPSFDKANGVGRVTLAQSWCENANGGNQGTVTFTPGGTTQVNVNVFNSNTCSSYNQIDAVVWWSESASNPHQRIDLYLFSPANQLVASSTHSTSVFQKIRYRPSGGIAAGQYYMAVVTPTPVTRNVKVYFRNRRSYRP